MSTAVPATMAPLEGVMSPPFLLAAARLRLLDAVTTPFLRISEHPPKAKEVRRFLAPFFEMGIPVTLQLMGTDPELLRCAAQAAATLPVAGLNFNCGCPSKQVVSGGAGGGILKTPERLLECAAAIRAGAPLLPLAVKMRTGFASAAEMTAILPELSRCGTTAIELHFRTVQEGYAPAPGREERLKEAVLLAAPLPLWANGDVTTAEDAEHLIKTTGAAGVLIGRGFLRDPWIFRRIAGAEDCPPPEEARQIWIDEVRRAGVRVGAAIELTNLAWGKENPFFEKLKKMPQNSLWDA